MPFALPPVFPQTTFCPPVGRRLGNSAARPYVVPLATKNFRVRQSSHKKKSGPRPFSRPDWVSGETPQDDMVFHARALSCGARLSGLSRRPQYQGTIAILVLCVSTIVTRAIRACSYPLYVSCKNAKPFLLGVADAEILTVSPVCHGSTFRPRRAHRFFQSVEFGTLARTVFTYLRVCTLRGCPGIEPGGAVAFHHIQWIVGIEPTYPYPTTPTSKDLQSPFDFTLDVSLAAKIEDPSMWRPSLRAVTTILQMSFSA